MRVTVLGSSGTYTGADRRCASYLVEHDGHRVVLDLGNGSLGNLQRVCEVTEIDAVVLSHHHPDHIVDTYGLYYALRFQPEGPVPVPVYAPPGTQAHLAQLLGDDDVFGQVCRFVPVQAGDRATVGPFTLQFFAAAHPGPALAMRVSADGRVVAYSGDSGPTPALVDCARSADLFVADSTWLERNGPYPAALHMTGADAGRHAAEAGAARLLVTHVFPPTDPDEVAAEAAAVFDGEVLVATDLMELPL